MLSAQKYGKNLHVNYSPFGAILPGRNHSTTSYRYGAANGQEKDDEVKGVGNHYSFGDYGYDPRLVRRWQLDPVVKHHESPYAAFANSPIWIMDTDGRDTLVMHKYNIESPKGLVFSVVTFSIIKDGVEKKIPEMMYLSSNAHYRQLPENSTFKLSFRPMGNHPEWVDAIYIHYDYKPNQAGMFIHPGSPTWNLGCIAISCEFPKTQVMSDGAGGIYNYARFTEQQGMDALAYLRDIYDSYSGSLSGDKFIIKTNSVAKTDHTVEKVKPKGLQLTPPSIQPSKIPVAKNRNEGGDQKSTPDSNE